MRVADGGRIDRTRRLSFTFDGVAMTGFEGDTLASALLANGVDLVGRSFKYHRRRGIFSNGPEEPNALVRLRVGARMEPNTRATMVPLYDGLVAESQNRWPTLAHDIQALNWLIAPWIPAGFYYKTFMGRAANTRLWMWFEKSIRRAAGMGTGTHEADPDDYDKMTAHCEVLVIGGGPSGLAAARAAAAGGGRVVLVDEREDFGGRLLMDRETIDGEEGAAWAARMRAELAALSNVRLLPRTTAFGYYDHNRIGCVERVSDHLIEPEPHRPRQRLWSIRAAEVVLATGAIEQPLAFADNDLPGVMLAGAVRAYANQYGVKVGERIVIATNNDDAYRTACDLDDAGAWVEAVVDMRPKGAEPTLRAAIKERGIDILHGWAPVKAQGTKRVRGLAILKIDETGKPVGNQRAASCDIVAISGGWQPTLHLFSQTGAKAVWDDAKACFLPGPPRQRERSAGACAGRFTLSECLEGGHAAGLDAAEKAGAARPTLAAPRAEVTPQNPPRAIWECPKPVNTPGKRFVDLQDDVAVSDIQLAHREGYVSVEHLKRYTTLGMGTDQGKTSNIAGFAVMAAARGVEIGRTGTTTFRPPYTPVALGALAGPEVGEHYAPLRRTPMDSWHAERGCTWIDAGLWRRPRTYPAHEGEGLFDAYIRETKAVRGSLGLCDVTTLGKIDIQGPDAAEFLNRLYINGWKTLPVGKARYGLMLREDGLVLDDGTTSRLGETHFLMTTTTANAVRIMAWIEYYLQVVWPDLRVKATSVTEQWAAMAIAGPKARECLATVVDRDLSNEAFPFMACGPCVIDKGVAGAEIPARLFRISFSGELAYELNVPADHGRAAWERLMAAGAPFDIVPYGMEALGNMRIEKGHVAGPELDGRTTAEDLGLGRMMSSKKDFIGAQLARRPDMTRPDRKQLVGLVPVDGKTRLGQGAQLVAADAPARAGSLAAGGAPVAMIGHVTSTGYSPELDHPIALGLVENGRARHEEVIAMRDPVRGRETKVRIVAPVFVDPEGERLHG
ncbi:sarcosine oxidase subunit alpha family protein [Marivibrio halodurans]|uniref:Sarcosine oxidase subunit alpha family protein n=2 Tax=Marivibrio halodurans TaxID=2039722 RepID=A0A8J7S0H6_9PROT|nr:sarcosine oxidase subunit alpha family protein [Marivibrio halodurans]MBP5856408.1 sarcosine oxidase subunit alpha family protein [Marivibrio halodurans]